MNSICKLFFLFSLSVSAVVACADNCETTLFGSGKVIPAEAKYDHRTDASLGSRKILETEAMLIENRARSYRDFLEAPKSELPEVSTDWTAASNSLRIFRRTNGAAIEVARAGVAFDSTETYVPNIGTGAEILVLRDRGKVVAFVENFTRLGYNPQKITILDGNCNAKEILSLKAHDNWMLQYNKASCAAVPELQRLYALAQKKTPQAPVAKAKSGVSFSSTDFAQVAPLNPIYFQACKAQDGQMAKIGNSSPGKIICICPLEAVGDPLKTINPHQQGCRGDIKKIPEDQAEAVAFQKLVTQAGIRSQILGEAELKDMEEKCTQYGKELGIPLAPGSTTPMPLSPLLDGPVENVERKI